ncbi:MAG: hypothetical protein ACYSUI_08885 [Planctomycetota bacterium]|jgi:hypothetical protein
MTPKASLREIILIGVDGGATEVKAHAVVCDESTSPPAFSLLPASASRTYQRLPDFRPLPIAEQLTQRNGREIRLCEKEEQQGNLWVEAARDAIVEVAETCQAQQVLIGMGVPGLKTPDGRGICVINNGPRIPDYLDRLERALATAGVTLASPVATLGSDADYCGLGEQHAAEGLFKDVENAYYVGGGTGLADAVKLRGRLISFDNARSWILKSWQIPSALGSTFENLVSARALNEAYVNLIPGALQPDPELTFPERAAAAGRPLATACLNTAALVLAELIFERLDTIKNGRRDVPHRGRAYRELDTTHEYRGTLLDRVVIGQRLGQIYGDDRFRALFADHVEKYLAALIAESGDAELAGTHLEGTRLKPGFVRASLLRAAPAIGAAVAAVQALRAGGPADAP